jgi:hypothetical protein
MKAAEDEASFLPLSRLAGVGQVLTLNGGRPVFVRIVPVLGLLLCVRSSCSVDDGLLHDGLESLAYLIGIGR